MTSDIDLCHEAALANEGWNLAYDICSSKIIKDQLFNRRQIAYSKCPDRPKEK